MDKYLNMKNPPRFSGEWKYYAFYLLDILTVGGGLFLAKSVNGLAHLPLLFSLLNYLFWFYLSVVIVWKSVLNPGQRQVFAIVESIFLSDTNHYHALDQNRKYHKQK
ncbi:hypothetical protein ACFC3P_12355 [Enterococcus thailandicus]|uniref:hypothetical protein n=1 Tax=Enterococcus thailandicus TaxID=417368 RepID=UPI0035DA12E3